ncbi:hypothetical protein [Enterobacter roggenkampii]|uniref:hypothetical protein n=1 Tax=Enterobacter roggenkampii TaxID=1812935 RepID=UPI002F2F5114
MNVYKLNVRTQGYWFLNKDEYEQRTARRSPWYKVSDKGKPRYFAICPACNNPIQIIGFYKLPSNVNSPFAKHYGTSVPGVGIFDHEAYLDCPYSDTTKSTSSDKGKRTPSELSRQILEILIEHFDKVIWMLSTVTGIKIEEKLALDMLKQYKQEEGWLYSKATLMNIPWIFAYMSDNQKFLFKKINDLKLLQKLVSLAPDELDMTSRGYIVKAATCKKRIELGVYYTRHHSAVTEHILSESMDMVILLEVNGEKPRELYRKSIDFDFNYFNNIVNFSSWKSTELGNKLLMHAKDILGECL